MFGSLGYGIIKIINRNYQSVLQVDLTDIPKATPKHQNKKANITNFATLRLVTQSPAVWIRTRKADELFATLRLVTHAPAVWDPLLTYKQNKQKDYLVRDSLFACYLAMTYFPRGLRPKYHRPWRS